MSGCERQSSIIKNKSRLTRPKKCRPRLSDQQEEAQGQQTRKKPRARRSRAFPTVQAFNYFKQGTNIIRRNREPLPDSEEECDQAEEIPTMDQLQALRQKQDSDLIQNTVIFGRIRRIFFIG